MQSVVVGDIVCLEMHNIDPDLCVKKVTKTVPSVLYTYIYNGGSSDLCSALETFQEFMRATGKKPECFRENKVLFFASSKLCYLCVNQH